MRAIHSPVEPLLLGSPGWCHRYRCYKYGLSSSRLNTVRCFSIAAPEPEVTQRQRYYENGLKSLLAALRQNDTVKLYFSLMDLTRGVHSPLHRQAFSAVVYQIPVTTFSDIFRAFDPFTVAHQVDSTSGLRISYGAALTTPLGELVSKWGVKVLYVQILNRLILMARARRKECRNREEPILKLLPNDYRILIRCAGATSDIKLAKSLYRQMKTDNYLSWHTSEIFTDFIKAWYLTEPLYTRHDMAAVRVGPLDLHLDLKPSILRRLRGIEHNRVKRSGVSRFGQMVRRRYYAESVRKILQLRKPLDGLTKAGLLADDMNGEDEALVCALIKARGRNGGVDHINTLLERFWGIEIEQETKESKIIYRISGGRDDISPSTCIAPTEALLDAIVHGYGNSAEVQLAGNLIQYVSTRFSIPIPDQVWSDLLSYARIHGARPAHREWLMARMPQKVPRFNYIFELWQTATSAPYDFNPRLEDYLQLLKEQVARGRVFMFTDWNLELIRQVKTLYAALTQQLQTAWADLIHHTHQGVPNQAAYRRFRMLQSRKYYVWHTFSYIAQRMLRHLEPRSTSDARAVRFVPGLILELGDFMQTNVKYRIATGIVEFKLDRVTWRDLQDLDEEVDDGAAAAGAGSQAKARSANHGKDDDEQHRSEEGVERAAEEEGDQEFPHGGPDPDTIPSVVKIPRDRNWWSKQLFLRPAFGRRPPYTGPPGTTSYTSLKEQGQVFKGYEHEPKYAARETVVITKRVRATPVDLDARLSTKETLEQLIRMRR